MSASAPSGRMEKPEEASAPSGRMERPDSGAKQGRGGDMGATDYNLIQINGGILHIDAGGDGIDSNGNLTVTGGEIYVYGPTNSGNGALDYAD